MKKRLFTIIYLTFLTVFLIGCSNNDNKMLKTSNVDTILEQQVANEDMEDENTNTEKATNTEDDSNSELKTSSSSEIMNTKTPASEVSEIQKPVTDYGYKQIDYDLSIMSSDMIYATVYQLMTNPQEYVGKIIKMSGLYYASFYKPTNQYYHYVIIKDATACCTQGVEFLWGDGSHLYPDEYPDDNSEVEVIGVFETYKESGDDNLYCRISNAEFTVIE